MKQVILHIGYKITQSFLHFMIFWARRKIDLKYLIARIMGKKVPAPLDAFYNTMVMVGALSDVETKFGIPQRTSIAAQLYGQLIRNELPDREALGHASTMFSSKKKRRAVYDVMLHYKDILPHQVDFKFPGEARAEFEAWLDEEFEQKPKLE